MARNRDHKEKGEATEQEEKSNTSQFFVFSNTAYLGFFVIVAALAIFILYLATQPKACAEEYALCADGTAYLKYSCASGQRSLVNYAQDPCSNSVRTPTARPVTPTPTAAATPTVSATSRWDSAPSNFVDSAATLKQLVMNQLGLASKCIDASVSGMLNYYCSSTKTASQTNPDILFSLKQSAGSRFAPASGFENTATFGRLYRLVNETGTSGPRMGFAMFCANYTYRLDAYYPVQAEASNGLSEKLLALCKP